MKSYEEKLLAMVIKPKKIEAFEIERFRLFYHI